MADGLEPGQELVGALIGYAVEAKKVGHRAQVGLFSKRRKARVQEVHEQRKAVALHGALSKINDLALGQLSWGQLCGHVAGNAAQLHHRGWSLLIFS